MEAIWKCSRSLPARNKCRKLTWSDSTEMSQLEVPRAGGSGGSAHTPLTTSLSPFAAGHPAAPRRDSRPMVTRGTRSMLYPRRPIIRCVIVAFVGGHAECGCRHRADPPSHPLEYTSVAGLGSRSKKSPRSLQAIMHAGLECGEFFGEFFPLQITTIRMY